MADSKDVTLQIRARDFSQKTLEQVASALLDLTKAQQAQIDGAKKGEQSASQLESSYKKLEQAAQALVKQNAVINTFNAQADAFDAAKAKSESLRAVQTELAKAMAATENPTKAQVKALNDATKSANAAETAQQRLLDRLNKTSARLAEYGIDAQNVGIAQAKIVESVNLANEALGRQQAAIDSIDSDLKTHRDALAAAAQEEVAYANAVKEATRFQQEQAAQAAAFQEKTDAAATLAKRIQYEYELGQVLEQRARAEAEAAAQEKQLAEFDSAIAAQREHEIALSLQQQEDQERERQSLQRLAEQLQITTAAYATQARARTQGQQFNLGQQLQDLANPSQASLRTIDGVSDSVDKLKAKADALKGPVKDLTQTLQALTAAQKGAAQIGSQIDAYRQQVAAVRASRQAYVDARQAVNDLAASLQQGVATGNVVNQISSAEAKLRAAAQAMQDQTTKARTLRTELQAIGVDTADLAGAEQRLVSTVETATSATNGYTAAVERYGKARTDGASALDRFNGGERTTLGFMQRLRGEVLGLVAAYGGVQGAIDVAKGTLDTVAKLAQVQSRLNIAFEGDQGKTKTQLDQVRKTADNLGVSYLDAADGYSRLVAAAKNSTLPLEDIMFIFQGITKYAASSGLSSEAYGRTLVALEQIIGKGQIGAQDLVQQLGNDLPAAVGALAKGIGVTEPQLRKLMETTHLSSNALINMIAELNKAGDTGVDQGVLALQKASGRLATAKTDFQLALAKGGFEDAYIDFIKRLTVLLQGDQGKDLAKKLSQAFTAVVNVLQFLADHITALEVLFGAFTVTKFVEGMLAIVSAVKLANTALEAFVAKQVVFAELETAAGVLPKVATGFTGVAVGIGEATLAAGGLTVALGTVAAVLAVITAGFVVFQKMRDDPRFQRAVELAANRGGEGGLSPDFLDVANGKVDPDTGLPKDASAPAPAGAASAPGGAAGDKTAPGVPTPSDGVTAVDIYYAQVKQEIDKQQKQLDQQSREARARTAKQELDDRISIATEVLRQQRDEITAQLGNSAQGAVAMARINQQIAEATATETTKFENEQRTKRDAAAKQLETLLRETGAEIQTIAAANEQKLTSLDPTADFEQRLKARMDAVNKQFDRINEQIAKIRKLSPKDADTVAAQVNALRGPAGDVAVEQTANDELVRLQTRLNELTQARTAELAEQKALFEAGGESSDQLLANSKAINDKFQQSIQKAIDDVRTFAATVKSVQNDPGKAAGINAKLGTAQANNNADKQNLELDLSNATAKVNALLVQRQALLDDIESKRHLGLVTDSQAADQMNAVNAKFKDEILDAGATINAYIDALEKFTKDPTVIAALEQQRQKMQQIQDTTKKNQQVWTEYETQIQQGSADVIVSGLENIGTELGKISSGQETAAQGARSWARSTALAFLQMIEQASAYIIKLQIIKALQSFGSSGAVSSGGADAGATSAEGVSDLSNIAHTGGVLGSRNGQRRSAPVSLWANAPRFHSGGVPGLSRDEVAIIAKKNEEVVTREDKRHVLNGGKNTPDRQQPPVLAQRFVFVDDQRDVHAAMASAQGEEVTVQNIKKNAATIRRILGQ